MVIMVIMGYLIVGFIVPFLNNSYLCGVCVGVCVWKGGGVVVPIEITLWGPLSILQHKHVHLCLNHRQINNTVNERMMYSMTTNNHTHLYMVTFIYNNNECIL